MRSAASIYAPDPPAGFVDISDIATLAGLFWQLEGNAAAVVPCVVSMPHSSAKKDE